jgi:hypothetical protein
MICWGYKHPLQIKTLAISLTPVYGPQFAARGSSPSFLWQRIEDEEQSLDDNKEEY